MNAFQRLTLTGTLAIGLLMASPSTAFASESVPVVNISSITITPSGDSSGWTISFITPSNAPSDASYLVATNEGSYCTASGTGLVEGTVSCDVPLLGDPATEPTVSRIDVIPHDYDPTTNGFPVDFSSATVALNEDGSGWTITWKTATVPGSTTIGSYVVNTTDGSMCSAEAADAVDGVASCDVGLLDDPSVAPEIASIRRFPPIVEHSNGPTLSVDITTATIVLNGDGTGWTVTWSELASDHGQPPYVVLATSGDTCSVDGTGVEGTKLSCDLPLLDNPSALPTLDSIRTVSIMYDSRGALGGGSVSYASSTERPTSTLLTAVPHMADKVVFHNGGRSSTWVWSSGIIGLLLGGVVLLRRKIGVHA